MIVAVRASPVIIPISPTVSPMPIWVMKRGGWPGAESTTTPSRPEITM